MVPGAGVLRRRCCGGRGRRAHPRDHRRHRLADHPRLNWERTLRARATTADAGENVSEAATFTLEFSAAGPGAQVAAVGGAVALHEARELERGVIAGIRHGRTRVVLDLHGVTEVRPGLLGVLLRIRRGVTQVDGRLAMVVAGPPVSDLVRTTVLAALIDIADDRDGALAIVGASNTGEA